MMEILMKKEQEIGFLQEIIRTHLGVEVRNNPCRVRQVVNAKMIYASLLHDHSGMGCSVIAKSIGMNHASILYYFRNIKGFLKSDALLSRSYQRIKSEFLTEYNPVYYMTEIELKRELISLRIENKNLSSSLSKSTDDLSKLQKDNDRVLPLINMIKQRTRKGSEKKIEQKLNQFYNGVYDN